MNSFLNSLKRENNFSLTENGGSTHKSTLNAIYDMFALGGAYRNRTAADCILLFKKALKEDETLALKCLFYLRDILGGAGERRFFRVCYNWLANEYPEIAFRNLDLIPEYGRWDDLYALVGTEIEADAFDVIQCQLNRDLASLTKSSKEGVSLLAKWLKSENASAKETKELGNKTRKYLGWSHAKYRRLLSALRTRINIVEKLMSENRWSEIEYDKIPSKAGLIYRNAFAFRDAERYTNFINSKNTKVNAATLYPYDIVRGVTSKINHWRNTDNLNDMERRTLNKYWENQKNYFDNKPCKIMCIVDTSGSMTGGGYGNVTPIDVAISLGMYCAERIEGPFKDYFISFSSRPQLIEIEGIDFCDKVQRIYRQNLCSNTNLKAVFDMLLEIYVSGRAKEEDMPEQLVIISDMEIDRGSYWRDDNTKNTEMELIRKEWAAAGVKVPKLVYWNVNARHNNILDDIDNPEITYISGCSPIILQNVLAGKSGIELMLDKLNSERYSKIK